MIKEYYFDEDGIKRRKKGEIAELQDINVNEISLVDSPASKKTFSVIKNLEAKKGDEDMDELRGWEAISEKEILTIRETIKILDKYDLTNDLKRTKATLTKYFGESEVKKYNERCEFSTVQRQLFGYCEDDLDFISDEDIYEVSKSSEDDKWPSLSRRFNSNKRQLEKIWEERELESRAI